jgi:hypothetical protein
MKNNVQFGFAHRKKNTTFFVASLTALTLLVTATVVQAENRRFELSFPSNSFHTVVSDGIVRGNHHDHYFGAQAGQAISIAVTSPENNAVFSLLYMQNGTWQEQTYNQKAWFGNLPPSDNNRYIISIGPTRGNTSYDLFVGISRPNF